jgi:hypothetical protein
MHRQYAYRETVVKRRGVADRKFLTDVLGLRSPDAGGGWPIFGLPPSEVAVHSEEAGKPGHELCLLCDDVDATVADVRT